MKPIIINNGTCPPPASCVEIYRNHRNHLYLGYFLGEITKYIKDSYFVLIPTQGLYIWKIGRTGLSEVFFRLKQRPIYMYIIM